MKLLIIDIDGTIADFKRRERLAGTMPPRSDKQLFQTWLDKLQSPQHLRADKPIEHVLATVQLIVNSGVQCVYLTGRSEKYREATADWLRKNKAPNIPLHMRSNRDWRRPKDYKKAVILKLLDEYKVKASDTMTIDDDYDGDCNPMYLKLGILHLKVYCP